MAEDKDELLQHYRCTREELIAAIGGLSDELLTEPSLDGWSVKDHLAHLATWDEIRAQEVARISAGHDSACG
ncbi:MAG: maleylpyruvate isomerase N-terminal domain-containing protein [Dehalococcoidia bacterium]